MYSFFIGMVLSLHNIVGVQEENLGVQEETAFNEYKIILGRQTINL